VPLLRIFMAGAMDEDRQEAEVSGGAEVTGEEAGETMEKVTLYSISL